VWSHSCKMLTSAAMNFNRDQCFVRTTAFYILSSMYTIEDVHVGRTEDRSGQETGV
jgi:hypothetical protein